MSDTRRVMDERVRFEQLYREYASRIRAYARRRLVSESVADDVVSDVFLELWRRLDEVPDEPLAWLYGIARRSLADRRRGDARVSAPRERPASERDLTATSVAPDRDADGPTLRALEQLSPEDRELLMLIAWERLDPVELATALDAEPSTLAIRLDHARQRFAVALGTQDKLAILPVQAPR